MEIIEKSENGIFIAELKGRVDTSNSGEFEKKLREVTDKEKNLLLDCSGLEYVSSMGLRVFLLILKKIKSLDGRLVIFGFCERVSEIFAISGFCDLFSCFETKEQAMEALKVKTP
jgi:anti-sigma B factor antagonist